MERKLLFQLRKQKNLTQQELAEELDLSTVYVRKLEKGVVKPGRDTLVKYENYFNRDMRDLFPDLFCVDDDKKLIKEGVVS